METFDQPLLINLLYIQIVHDTFSTICIRISEAERTNMKTFLCKLSIQNIDLNIFIVSIFSFTWRCSFK